MAKISLTANTPVVLYKSRSGQKQFPSRVDFRIDSAAASDTVVRFATSSSGELVLNKNGTVKNTSTTTGGVVGWSQWMFLLTDEVKSEDQLIAGNSVAVVSTTNVDVYYEVSASA